MQLRTSMPVSIRVVQTRTSSSPFSSFCQTGFSSSSVILPWAMPTRAPGAIRWTRAGGRFDVVHPVVQVVDLPAPGQLLFDGLGQDDLVVLQDERFHRLPLKGRFLDGGHIPDAAHGHAEGAGDGGGGQGEHIHPDEVLFQFFLVADAEALFLVDDDKAQVVEADVLGQQAVGAHHDVHAAGLQAPQGLFCCLAVRKRLSSSTLTGKASIRDRMVL